MKRLILILLTLISSEISAQSYQESIVKHREHYKNEFLESGSNSPLKKEDLAFLRFYEPDESFKVNCTFKKSDNVSPFKMMTSSGKKKEYYKYGILSFQLQGQNVELNVYRSMDLMSIPKYKNYLFIPFKDATNGKDTYGGGRYLELETTDIQNDSVILDFNKAYNPYCAFSDGYSCPIPPKENHLVVLIEAGEKTFGKEH